jgi:hypothetical protein
MLDYIAIWNKVENLPWCTLVASGRTGSDAFQSYLDSHPEVFLIPGHIFLHRYWNTLRTTCFEGELNSGDVADEFIGRFIHKLKTKYDGQERMDILGENMDQSINLPVAAFRKHLVGLLAEKPLMSRYLVQAVYVAYALTVDQDINAKKLFFDHVHHIRKVPDVIADFPDCKVICMTRDPRAAYVSAADSWRIYSDETSLEQPETHSTAWQLSVLQRIMDEPRALAIYGDKFRVLRLEDLDDEDVKQKVCKWIGISFRPEVMTSTWGGLRWWGDRKSVVVPDKTMSEKEFNNAIRTSKWEMRLPALDKYVFNYLLYDRLRQCRYSCEEKPGILTFVLIVVAIFVPTTYERLDFSPKRLLTLLCGGRFRRLFSAPYNYARRVIYYFRLLNRRLTGNRFDLPLFENTQDASRHVID